MSAYTLRVLNDSMRPRYRRNDILILDPDVACAAEDDVFIKLWNGERMVKQLLIKQADEIVVTDVNDGEGQTIAKADIEYIHCVTDIMRAK